MKMREIKICKSLSTPLLGCFAVLNSNQYVFYSYLRVNSVNKHQKIFFDHFSKIIAIFVFLALFAALLLGRYAVFNSEPWHTLSTIA